ncbi:ABC transporter substrate-binding protein [uncultured Veillonella sp.]|uniref:ABC transporter substrate-binding protein n=1 Tax=uncultured Veillonella sp. TaxID=159268 RepID=UPI002623DFB4|nr:ABC transporter substrate-binding protein [uncultured Veillonella sp.]
MKTFKWKSLCSLALAATLFMAGCDGDSNSGSTTVPEGKSVSQSKDVVAAIPVDITTMDPMDTSDTLSGGIQRLVMDGLYSFDDDMKLKPMLATGYTANKEATEYTFTLRKGVKFTDGTDWNADAAIANVNKWTDKSLGLKRTNFISGVIEKVEKIDDYTIKFTLNKPFGAFVNNMAHPAMVMMSPKQLAQGVDVTAKHPVGTGQYKFVEWVPGDHIKLELNKDWWGYNKEVSGGETIVATDAGFKSISFKPVIESASRVAMLQSGDAQMVFDVPTEGFAALKDDPNIKAEEIESIVVRYLFMNTQKPALSDIRVRQAIAHGIDKQAFLNVVRNGLGTVATSVIGPNVQFYKGNDPVPYDVAKAKALLKEAGYENGLTLKMLIFNTTSSLKQAEFYKQQLAEIGINVEIVSMESAIVNQKVQGFRGEGKDAEYDLYIAGWSPSTGDADWGIRPLLASESIPPLNYNLSYYQNPEMDGYIQAALTTSDNEARKAAYEKAQDLFWKDIPMIAVSNEPATWATSSKIVNVRLYPDNGINMSKARMAE